MGIFTKTKPDIIEALKKTEGYLEEFNKLSDTLSKNLRERWKQDFGTNMPSADQADVYQVDVFARYEKGLNPDDYINEVKQVMKSSTNPNIVAKVEGIATAIGGIIKLAIGNVSVV